MAIVLTSFTLLTASSRCQVPFSLYQHPIFATSRHRFSGWCFGTLWVPMDFFYDFPETVGINGL